MNALSNEIRDVIDDYHVASGARRLEISKFAMQRLFIAERVWRGISKVDITEERINGDMT